MAFEQYLEEKKAWDKDHPVEMCHIIPADSFSFNKSLFLQTIDNVNTMNDEDLHKFIDMNFKNIINNVFSGPEPDKYLKCFTDRRFLQTFNEVISTYNQFSYNDTVRLNTMAYHYTTLPDNRKDPTIMGLMIGMSRIVNRSQIPHLLGLGLTDTLATMLVMARYSDINLDVCVKRVDFIIITQPVTLMTEQMIAEIFKILYDIFGTFYQVFTYVMTDVIPDFDENNLSTWWVTSEIQEVDSTMSLAILDILENLPTEIIRQTLINYTEGLRLTHPGKPIKFSMRRLAEDYYRINEVIARLQYEDDIIVP